MPRTPAIRRAYSYVRFSTPEQAKGDSLRRQTERTAALCERMGYVLDDSLRLRDLGISAWKGDNFAVGALGKFVEAVASGRVPPGSVLIVESLDRLSRDQVDEALTKFLDLLKHKITIVTTNPERFYDPADRSPMKLIEPLLVFTRANEESERKSERVGEAWGQRRQRARAQGAPLTAKCPAWLTVTTDGYQVIEPRARTVRRIYELCLSGLGAPAITREMVREGHEPFGSKGWVQPYVRKLLTFRAVTGECQPKLWKGGKREPDGDAIANFYPVVIDEETFYRAQAALRSRHRKGHREGKGTGGAANLLTGLAYDAASGLPLRYLSPIKNGKVGRKRPYLQPAALENGRAKEKGKYPLVDYGHLEDAIFTYLDEMTPEDVDGSAAADALRREEKEAEGRLAVVEETLARAEEEAAKDEDAFLSFAGVIRRLTLEKRELTEKLERLSVQTATDRVWAVKDAHGILGLMKTAKGDKLARLRERIRGRLRELVHKVYVLTVPRGRWRLVVVQFRLHDGATRDYLIVYDRLGKSEATSTRWEDGEPLDLRKPDHVARLERALLAADLTPGQAGE